MSQKGYTEELLVLPFDHRNSFQEKMFGIYGDPNPEQTELVASYKMMIFEAFEKAVAKGLPKKYMGILVDEQFGTEILKKANAHGITTCVCAEKSGQDEFDFEYGKDYQAHIEKVNPDILKVLVRYNPESDKEMNQRQAKRLAELGRYLEKTKRKYMFELLVPATKEQMAKVKEDKKVYDLELRPQLMIQAMKELQDAGVEPDIWKLEGLDRTQDFEKVCQTAQRNGRSNVGCIVLGRGENAEKVKNWLEVGANVKGVVGFAVGRTVFWEPLKAFRENKISRDEAIQRMCNVYSEFCNLWLKTRGLTA